MVNEERKRLKTTKCEVFSYPMHGELKTVKESKKRQERFRNIGLSSQQKCNHHRCSHFWLSLVASLEERWPHQADYGDGEKCEAVRW